MKNYLYIIVCFTLVIACQNEPLNENILLNEEMLLHNLKLISHDSLEGRFFGTEGNKKAQQYISHQFDSLGIDSAFSYGVSLQIVRTPISKKLRETFLCLT